MAVGEQLADKHASLFRQWQRKKRFVSSVPYVSGLGVNPEDRLEAGGEGGQLRPVAKVKVVIVPGKEANRS